MLIVDMGGTQSIETGDLGLQSRLCISRSSPDAMSLAVQTG
nr:hypothetical protein [Rhizobium leguminosarum]